MAGKCTAINTGKFKMYVAPMGVACVEPPFPTTNTTVGTAATRSVAPASITVTALPAGFDLAAGKFLNFTNPTTGEEVIVQTTARVQAAATTIPVTNVPAALPIGAIMQWPPRLTGRTGANFQRQGNLINVQTFDSAGDDEGRVVSRATTFDLPGVQSPLSAAFQNIFTLAVGEFLWFWGREDAYDANYTRGLEVKGLISISTDGINWSPSDVTRNDLTATFNGTPTIVQPVLAP
ncbi:MAG: hypothetical protein ACRC62_29570 [Microcoleus sp.]